MYGIRSPAECVRITGSLSCKKSWLAIRKLFDLKASKYIYDSSVRKLLMGISVHPYIESLLTLYVASSMCMLQNECAECRTKKLSYSFIDYIFSFSL